MNMTIPQTWIRERLNMCKISERVVNFLPTAIKNWRVELAAEGQPQAEFKR